jgi:hypothetical protein
VTGLLVAALSLPVRGQGPEQTQIISLKKGWNAVFLEVEPLEPSPDALFADTQISQAAAWFPSSNTVEYLTDPGEQPWKRKGWGIWYSPRRPDAFLKSLHAIQANQAYLLHADSDYTWQVRGTRRFLPHSWKANSFNFVGFGVDPLSPPTFEQFFAGSTAHSKMRIYRLIGGKWKLVTTPRSTQMQAGEAFWIDCEGASEFQGPLRVNIGSNIAQGLQFGPSSGTATLTLRNDGSDPLDLQFDFGGGLPLALSVRNLQEDADSIEDLAVRLGASESMNSFEAGESFALTLQVYQQEMTEQVQEGLLTITTSLGTKHYLPMAAASPGLLTP